MLSCVHLRALRPKINLVNSPNMFVAIHSPAEERYLHWALYPKDGSDLNTASLKWLADILISRPMSSLARNLTTQSAQVRTLQHLKSLYRMQSKEMRHQLLAEEYHPTTHSTVPSTGRALSHSTRQTKVVVPITGSPSKPLTVDQSRGSLFGDSTTASSSMGKVLAYEVIQIVSSLFL